MLVYCGALVVIAGAQLLEGHTVAYSGTQGLIWAAVSATVYCAALIYRLRKGQHCAICRDPPEMQDGRADGSD